jgi:predicted lipoprotein
MKRFLNISVVLTAAVLLITACSKTDDPAGTPVVNPPAEFDKNAMLRYYADSVIIPGYAQFKADVSALTSASAGFMAAPSAATQQGAKAAYETAYRSYQRVSAFQFGPAETVLMDPFLNFSGGLDYSFNTAGALTGFSVDTASIDSFINVAASPDLTSQTRHSFYRQGFGALGYLLFGKNAITELQKPAPAARIAYINSLTDRMSTLLGNVINGWETGYRSEFTGNTKTNVGSPIGNMVNQFAFQLDLMKGPRIGWPFGKQSNGIVFAQKTEGYYAGISVALAVENLRALRNTYTAGKSGKGLADYLVSLGQATLNTDVLAQFDAALTKLQAIPDPLSTSLTANAGEVDAAYKEIQKLLTLLKTDVASATAVQITFMDNDGD